MKNTTYVIGVMMLITVFSVMYYGGRWYENRLDIVEWKADQTRKLAGDLNRKLDMYETYHLESGSPIPQRFYTRFCLQGYPDSTGLYEYPGSCNASDSTITIVWPGNE